MQKSISGKDDLKNKRGDAADSADNGESKGRPPLQILLALMLKLFNERGVKRGERVRVSGIGGERDGPGRGKSGFEIGKAAVARGTQDLADVLLLLNDPTEAALISVHSKNPFT